MNGTRPVLRFDNCCRPQAEVRVRLSSHKQDKQRPALDLFDEPASSQRGNTRPPTELSSRPPSVEASAPAHAGEHRGSRPPIADFAPPPREDALADMLKQQQSELLTLFRECAEELLNAHEDQLERHEVLLQSVFGDGATPRMPSKDRVREAKADGYREPLRQEGAAAALKDPIRPRPPVFEPEEEEGALGYISQMPESDPGRHGAALPCNLELMIAQAAASPGRAPKERVGAGPNEKAAPAMAQAMKMQQAQGTSADVRQVSDFDSQARTERGPSKGSVFSSELAINTDLPIPTRSNSKGQSPFRKRSISKYTEVKKKDRPVSSELQKALDMGGAVLPTSVHQTLSGWLNWWANLEQPKPTGMLARVVMDRRFESVCAAVILLNSVFTIYATNYAISHLDDPMQQTTLMEIAEPSFVLFYITELVLKLTVHKQWFFCNDEMAWNLFDLGLVIFSTWDWCVSYLAASRSGGNIAFMRTLRLLKMSRIIRMLRVIRVFRELKTMVFTLVGSLLALFWCLVMLAFILTIFGLIFVQFITGYIVEQGENMDPDFQDTLLTWWGSVQGAMATLYMATTGGQDWVVFYRQLQRTDENGGINGFLLLFYIAFFNFALINVLTGIFVEYTARVTQKDRDVLILDQRRKEKIEAEQLRHLVDGMDEDKSGTITLEEFDRYVEDERVAMLLASIGLDIKDTEAFFQILMDDSVNHQVNIDTFIEGCMHLKGNATAIDLQTLIYATKAIYTHQRSFNDEVSQRLEDVTQTLGQVTAALAMATTRKSGYAPRSVV